MKFDDSSNYRPTIDEAGLEFFASTPLKWYTIFGNPSEKEDEVTRAKILMNTTLTSQVKSAAVRFQNGFNIDFAENVPEILEIFQDFLVQRIWYIPYDEPFL